MPPGAPFSFKKRGENKSLFPSFDPSDTWIIVCLYDHHPAPLLSRVRGIMPSPQSMTAFWSLPIAGKRHQKICVCCVNLFQDMTIIHDCMDNGDSWPEKTNHGLRITIHDPSSHTEIFVLFIRIIIQWEMYSWMDQFHMKWESGWRLWQSRSSFSLRTGCF